MPLDAHGVTASLQPLCPLDGAAGPYPAADAGLYADGTGSYWRLTFSASASTAQQQAAASALAALTANPQSAPDFAPYRLNGSVTFSATLAVGSTTLSAPVSGLLRTDAPMLAFGALLPGGVEVRSICPDPSQDGSLLIQVAVLQVLSGSTTVPFTLLGVR